ncbi:MAG: hypothetical protein WCC52_07385, partial [Nitrosotalea sp.]
VVAKAKEVIVEETETTEVEIIDESQIDPTKPRTESEVIEIEEKLIEKVETFEEVEEELK